MYMSGFRVWRLGLKAPYSRETHCRPQYTIIMIIGTPQRYPQFWEAAYSYVYMYIYIYISISLSLSLSLSVFLYVHMYEHVTESGIRQDRILIGHCLALA